MSGQQNGSGRSPIPVLLAVRTLGWGGIERDVAKMALGLDRRRFTPHIAVFQDGGSRSDEVKAAGVPVLNLDVTSLASPRVLQSASKFSHWVLSRGIRVVHAFDAIAVFATPLARLLRVPLVLSSTLGSRELLDPKTRRHVPLTDRIVDGIVVNCEAMRRHMVEDYGVPEERTILCYNGVETSQFYPQPGPRPDAVRDASLVIGTMCVLRPEKRLDLLLEAFAAVRGLRPGVKLLIVGSGPELPALQAKAVALGITGDCVFEPATSSVAPYLRAIDIFVSCSSSEAFSNSVLEAMACGCCPVGSRVGGTPELIKDGERGLLFDSGHAADLAKQLATLIDDETLRAEFARRAADFAAHKLNMQVALDRIAEIYEEGLVKKGALAR